MASALLLSGSLSYSRPIIARRLFTSAARRVTGVEASWMLLPHSVLARGRSSVLQTAPAERRVFNADLSAYRPTVVSRRFVADRRVSCTA